MSRRIRAVEHGTCATGLSDAHHCLQDRILLNYTRIENAHKVRKISFLVIYRSPANFQLSFFPAEILSNA